MREWWLSSRRMTIWVKTRNGKIIDSAPIARKFRGQHLSNLARWMDRQGGFKYRRLRRNSNEK